MNKTQIREYLDSQVLSIMRQKQSLADGEYLWDSPNVLQELLRLNLIEDWLFSEINRLENPHPLDTP